MNEMKERIRTCCLEKELPPCTSACPFGLDVREFIPRMERGAFNLAYRLYVNAVAFPRIVSEICCEGCKEVCPKKESGGGVNLRMLEKAAVAYASRRTPNNYSLPPKGKKIAVIGAGISGLACALRLASKKYDVDVYEREERVGGHLWNILSPEIFLKDIEEQFTNEKYRLMLDENVTSLEGISSRYDAVYIATGKNGSCFGMECEPEKINNVRALENGIFMGGSLTGASSAEAIAHGLRASSLIEGWLKTGNMKSGETNVPTKIRFDLSKEAETREILPSNGTLYSEEEASAEAKRCIRCKCDFCVKSCDMMEYFGKFPKLIEEEVHITVNPGTLDGNGTVATRLISTCNQCGLCAEVCPEAIDVGIFLRESHCAMRKKNAMPWAFHEFWLNDMNFAHSERARFFYAPENDKCEYLFFPGCQMGASEPRYVTESYRLLKKYLPGTAILADCCGAPALWAGDRDIYDDMHKEFIKIWHNLGKPTVIFGCPTCMSMMKEKTPEIGGKMISDIFFELGVPIEIGENREVSVFDPCSARKLTETQNSVRALAEKAGCKIVPLPYEKESAKCCSWGGQISIANPVYAKWLTERRVSASELPYIVYCTNCRDIFTEAGKPAEHILDIILGIKERELRPPTYGHRRRNREYVKEILMKELTGKEESKEPATKLIISSEIEAKINRERILDDDIAAVINFCERTGRKLTDPDSGHNIGYCEIEHMTCWAEYSAVEDGFAVHNAYSHRMKIELEEVWHGRKQKTDM